MRPGTWVRLPDGREATVVYHGLDGYGIKWGLYNVSLGDLERFSPETPDEDFSWFPDAMLRDPYPSADVECVGEEYEMIGAPR